MSEWKTKNDYAWELLFEKYDILNQVDMNGCYEISAKQIKDYREPRLMTKFDHTINLPELFSKNGLSILPVSGSSYKISHFKAYHRFEPCSSEIIKVSLPDYIQSLNYNNVFSETVALNCAAASGILTDFLEDDSIIATVSGKMGSSSFDYTVNSTKGGMPILVNVDNSRMEIDAAYEGVKYLSLFEAKRDLSDDFLIRQLYYPYRTLLASDIDKEIKSVFFIYSNGIYHLYQYRFEDPHNYNSLVLVKQMNYAIEDTAITVKDIQDILSCAQYISEPEVPFPQADNFPRVINLCELLNEQDMSKDAITEKYAFDARQTDYYTNAARYLKLVEKAEEDNKVIYHLTPCAKTILHKKYKQRQLAFVSQILKHRVFARVLDKYFELGVMPSNDEIVEIMKISDLYNIESNVTFKRRASTIRGWLEWIVSLINE